MKAIGLHRLTLVSECFIDKMLVAIEFGDEIALACPVWSGSPDRPNFEKAKCRPEEKSPPPESK